MDTVKKVKTAVVGCGMISNIYIKNLKHMFSIIDLVAVCDINPEAAKEKAEAYGVEKIMTLEEIAASEEIELVVNLTGPGAHYSVIKTMLLAGKHVYTEKMLTPTLAESRELLNIAEEKNVRLAVAPDVVLSAGVQTARKVIDSGMIGKITSCVASINRNQSLNSEIFRFLRGNGGALPYDVGIYYIATLLTLIGPVKAVRGFGAPAPVHNARMLKKAAYGDSWQIPGNNVMVGALEFANGALGSVHFDGNSISEERSVLRIYGTEGILELGDPNTFGLSVKLIKPENGECEIPHTHGYNGTPLVPDPTVFDYSYGHRGIGVAELAWAIRRNRPHRLSKEMGYHAQEILCGLDVSCETGDTYYTESVFEISPLKSGYLSTILHGALQVDAELSLVD